MFRKRWVFLLVSIVFGLSLLLSCTPSPTSPTDSAQTLPASTAAPVETEMPDVATEPPAPVETAFKTALPSGSDPWMISTVNDLKDITVLARLGGSPLGNIQYVRWISDGKWLLVRGSNGTGLLDAETLAVQWVINETLAEVFSVQGDHFLTINGSGDFETRRISDGELVKTVELEKNSENKLGVKFLTISLNEELLAGAAGDMVRIWNLNSGKIIHEINFQPNYTFDIETVNNLLFSADGANLFVSTFMGGVYMVNVENEAVNNLYQPEFDPNADPGMPLLQECDATRRVHGTALVVFCKRYTPTEDNCCIKSVNHVAKVIDVNDMDHRLYFYNDPYEHDLVGISADGKTLLLESGDEVYQWDYQSGNPNPLSCQGDSVSLGPAGLGRAAVVNKNVSAGLGICDLATGETLISSWEVETVISSVAIGRSNDHYLVAAGNCGGEIGLWDPKTEQKQVAIQAHEGCVNNLAFSADGRFLASGGDDNRVELWNLAEADANSTFTFTHPSPVIDLALSSEGSFLISISKDQLQLWDVANQIQLASEEIEQGQAVALGPDGWMAYQDGTVVYWDRFVEADYDTTLHLGRLVFSSNAGTVVSIDHEDGTFWFFDAATGETLYHMENYEGSTLAGLSLDDCTLIGSEPYIGPSFWKVDGFELVSYGPLSANSEDLYAAISPDGRIGVISSAGGSVLVWGLPGVLDAPVGTEFQVEHCDQLQQPLPTLTATPTSTEPPAPTSTSSPTSTPTEVQPSPTPVSFERDLFLNDPPMVGDDVKALQMRLLELGYSEVGTPDGVFGSMTDEAIRKYQNDQGLVVDGIVGPLTWEQLFKDQ